ncbi:hypothetical protein QBC39DRAFT_91818 [Podospora conica]|nr:hypothetical protein QBC39DRAFT_91818 [Schizothecium conicum]
MKRRPPSQHTSLSSTGTTPSLVSTAHQKAARVLGLAHLRIASASNSGPLQVTYTVLHLYATDDNTALPPVHVQVMALAIGPMFAVGHHGLWAPRVVGFFAPLDGSGNRNEAEAEKGRERKLELHFGHKGEVWCRDLRIKVVESIKTNPVPRFCAKTGTLRVPWCRQLPSTVRPRIPLCFSSVGHGHGHGHERPTPSTDMHGLHVVHTLSRKPQRKGNSNGEDGLNESKRKRETEPESYEEERATPGRYAHGPRTA